MGFHQQLYEINTRNWLYTLKKKFKKEFTLLTIPDDIWKEIIDKGFDWIWLMGVWEHSPLHRDDLHRYPGLVQEIKQALPNWDYNDVIGSPYSITQYIPNPKLGQVGDLRILKNKLNDLGANLMLDFVPNHFGNASQLVFTNPEYFITIQDEPSDKSLFFPIETEKGKYWIAFGKDPYFPPWEDTFQLNFFNKTTRVFMIETLSTIAESCDGVRCDMAMLCLNEIINRTWGFYLQETEFEQPETEFWVEAINTIKSLFPDFMFLAEVYWDLGWNLQQLGFDFTYDKRLYDRLVQGTPRHVRDHLKASLNYQKKSLRFLENHDEPRASYTFGRERSLAAAVIMGTIPGLSLYHQGQLEGERIKIPVQLLQKQKELPDLKIKHCYDNLLTFTQQRTIINGYWTLLETSVAHSEDLSWKNILTWQWSLLDENKMSLIVVNYSEFQSQAKIHLLWANRFNDVDLLRFQDFVDGKIFTRMKDDLISEGLYVDLKPFQYHLFDIRDS